MANDVCGYAQKFVFSPFRCVCPDIKLHGWEWSEGLLILQLKD